jgi:hypothetical protein
MKKGWNFSQLRDPYTLYTFSTVESLAGYKESCDALKNCDGGVGNLQYWTFLYCSPFSYRSSNFAIAKLSLLIPLLQFL